MAIYKPIKDPQENVIDEKVLKREQMCNILEDPEIRKEFVNGFYDVLEGGGFFYEAWKTIRGYLVELGIIAVKQKSNDLVNKVLRLSKQCDDNNSLQTIAEVIEQLRYHCSLTDTSDKLWDSYLHWSHLSGGITTLEEYIVESIKEKEDSLIKEDS